MSFSVHVMVQIVQFRFFDNFIQIDDFEEFSYWFEQQIYYLTDEQFEKINGIWLRMMVKHYYRRDELAF